MIDPARISEHNERHLADHERDLSHTAEVIGRDGGDIEHVITEVAAFSVRGAVVGDGHRQHPVRPLPGRR